MHSLKDYSPYPSQGVSLDVHPQIEDTYNTYTMELAKKSSIMLFVTKGSGGCKDGAAGKSTHCSCRGL